MHYAQQLGVPYVFLSNGAEIRFWECEREAYPRIVKTFFKQDERRLATRQGATGISPPFLLISGS